MKPSHLALVAALAALLSCCERRDPAREILDKFESGWTVSQVYKGDKDSFSDIPTQKIADDSRTDLGGFTVWFNNLITDSRPTVMNYTEWNRILTSAKLSDEERIAKMAMLGGRGSIHPFEYEEGNRGFLVIDTKIREAWAEVWDREAVRRIRIDFEGRRPTIEDVPALLKRLAVLEWPTQTAEARLATPTSRLVGHITRNMNLNFRFNARPSGASS